MLKLRLTGVGIVVCLFGISLLAGPGAADNSEVAAACKDSEHLIELFTAGGRPINKDPNLKVKVLVNHGYVVGYNEDRRNPLWAAYKVCKAVAGQPVRFERAEFFYKDIRVNPAIDGRTFGGGHDRGHMVPNAAIASQYGSLAQMETFFMTNICPQSADLNQGPWQKLEHWITDTVTDLKHIYVISGPIFGASPTIISNGASRDVQVPDAFYMILVDMDKEFRPKPDISILAYKFPQTTAKNADFKDRAQFGASVREIEDATRLDFFPNFPAVFKDWDTRETEKEMTHW